MRSFSAPLLLAALLAPAFAHPQSAASPAAQPPPAQPAKPGAAAEPAKPGAAAEPAKANATADEETLYALGVVLTRDVKALGLTPSEVEAVKRGLTDALTGKKLAVDPAKYDQKLQAFATARIAATAQKNKESGKAFAATAAREPGAQKTSSGVVYRSLKEGTGASPKATDTVKLNIVGKLADGTVFDAGSGGSTEIALNQVFPCLSEGVAKMKVGGKAKLVCPAETAFGDQGNAPAVPPGATIVFEIELLAAKATPAAKPPGHPGGGMPGGTPGAKPPGHP